MGWPLRRRAKLKKPPLYQVVLMNDDYTPMDFVVEVLELIFGMDRQQATRIMLEVHTKGKGRCGVYTYEIAETKVAQVRELCAAASASADVLPWRKPDTHAKYRT